MSSTKTPRMLLNSTIKKITLVRYAPAGVVVPVLITNHGPAVIVVLPKSSPPGTSAIAAGHAQLVFPMDEGADIGSIKVELADKDKDKDKAEFSADIFQACPAEQKRSPPKRRRG